MKKHLKTIIFSLISVLSISIHADATIYSPIWIGVSPLVVSKMQAATEFPFKFIEKNFGNNEYFYKINQNEISKLVTFVHQNMSRCGGFRVLKNPPAKKILTINKSIPNVEFGEFWPNELDILNNADYSINRADDVLKFYENISQSYMNSVIAKLSQYHTRYFKSPEGIEAMLWIKSEWERIAISRSDIKVEAFKHANFEQASIILTIEGSDPIKKKQVIILGGHGDSINADGPELHLPAPGADDNAAGIALLSDIIKTIVETNYKPKHTIQFIAYAAEEVGLQGSEEIARTYHQNKTQVIGVMQFDGVNYKGSSYDMALIADTTNPAQNIFVAKLIDTYVRVNWNWEKCGYACSDQYSWHTEGYRASFPVETIGNEQNPFIHTSNDTFDKSYYNTEHASILEKVGMAYLVELDK